MNGSDDFRSPGLQAHRQPGIGLAMTRDCMPGNHRVLQTTGSAWVRYRGIRTWCCAACVARRAEAKNQSTAS